jgi:hypothetical protein
LLIDEDPYPDESSTDSAPQEDQGDRDAARDEGRHAHQVQVWTAVLS